MLNRQAALIYAMVVAAKSDHEIAPDTIDLVGDLAHDLPVFESLDRLCVTELAIACSERLATPCGAEEVYAEICAALAGPWREAAYALSCDVLAVDGRLETGDEAAIAWIRTQLGIDPARARKIEDAARSRAEAGVFSYRRARYAAI